MRHRCPLCKDATRTNKLAATGTPFFKNNTRDFSPRFALAWQPSKKTVVRTGYGIFFPAYPVGFGSYGVPTNNLAGNTTLVGQLIPSLSYPLTPFISQGTSTLPTVSGFNRHNNGNFTNQRPNSVAGVSSYPLDQTLSNWLNPAAFSIPAAGTFGNVGRNTIYGPGFAQLDVSLLKDTQISESSKLQFRAEFYNFINHPKPNITVGTAAFFHFRQHARHWDSPADPIGSETRFLRRRYTESSPM